MTTLQADDSDDAAAADRFALPQWRLGELDAALTGIHLQINAAREEHPPLHDLMALEGARRRLYGELTRRGL